MKNSIKAQLLNSEMNNVLGKPRCCYLIYINKLRPAQLLVCGQIRVGLFELLPLFGETELLQCLESGLWDGRWMPQAGLSLGLYRRPVRAGCRCLCPVWGSLLFPSAAVASICEDMSLLIWTSSKSRLMGISWSLTRPSADARHDKYGPVLPLKFKTDRNSACYLFDESRPEFSL